MSEALTELWRIRNDQDQENEQENADCNVCSTLFEKVLQLDWTNEEMKNAVEHLADRMNLAGSMSP